MGWALRVNPEQGGIPCHRVVNRCGEVCPGFVFGGDGEQRRLLEGEGVAFNETGGIDLNIFGWDGV